MLDDNTAPLLAATILEVKLASVEKCCFMSVPNTICTTSSRCTSRTYVDGKGGEFVSDTIWVSWPRRGIMCQISNILGSDVAKRNQNPALPAPPCYPNICP